LFPVSDYDILLMKWKSHFAKTISSRESLLAMLMYEILAEGNAYEKQ